MSDLGQGNLTEGEGSVQLTSLYWQVKVSCFRCSKHYLLFFIKMSFLDEEVNCTGPSASVSVPWLGLGSSGFSGSYDETF